MTITWLGDAGIRLQSKDTVLVIDPPAAGRVPKPTRQSAQLVALTQAEGRDAKQIGGEPLLVTHPGEYELSSVFVYGLRLASAPKQLHFRVEVEDMSLGHLGDLDHKLDNGELAQLEGVDILFVPVGGHGLLTADQAAELISQIEPRVVIPIQYQAVGLKTNYDGVEKFLKAFGAKQAEPLDKWKIAKKDLPAEETQVIVLTHS